MDVELDPILIRESRGNSGLFDAIIRRELALDVIVEKGGIHNSEPEEVDTFRQLSLDVVTRKELLGFQD